MIILKNTIQLEDLPSEDDLDAIFMFASTFDGYEHFGSFTSCAEAAANKKRSCIIELRNELFFAARASNHTGDRDAIIDVYKELLPFFKKLLTKNCSA